MGSSEVLWHPYSQHGLNEEILSVRSAGGAYLRLSDGREVLDAISSWWVNIHGHAHPAIAEAIYRQARELEHVIFAGFRHEPAERLAQTLIDAMRERGRDFSRVFFSDNGSTAVEVALKMAYQFHLNRGETTRRGFLALRGSYHGDTLGAMALGDPGGFHSAFGPLLPRVDFIEPDRIDELEAMLHRNPDGYAAFVFEPLLQGASGMRLYSAAFLEEAIALCRRHRVLNICDEVFTGFFRTGRCFAIEHTRAQPDLLCLSKGITGGFLPLAVTLAREEIFEAFLSKEIRAAFLHGHSYTANPIGCAAAIASWKLLQEPSCRERIESITTWTRQHVEELRSQRGVRAARAIGTVGAIELDVGGDYFSLDRRRILTAALKRGVLLRPLGNVLYAVPPYCVTAEELARIYRTMKEIAQHELRS